MKSLLDVRMLTIREIVPALLVVISLTVSGYTAYSDVKTELSLLRASIEGLPSLSKDTMALRGYMADIDSEFQQEVLELNDKINRISLEHTYHYEPRFVLVETRIDKLEKYHDVEK